MRNYSFIIIILVLLSGCEESGYNRASGTVQLTYEHKDLDIDQNERSKSSVPASLYIEYYDLADSILLSKKLNLIKIGNEYRTELIVFEEGTYQVETFLVLNDSDSTIYLTPKSGSELGKYVSDPLPRFFKVVPGESTSLISQVIYPDYGPAVNYGYATFSFDIFNPGSGTLNICEYTTIPCAFDSLCKKPGIKIPKASEIVGEWQMVSLLTVDSCNRYVKQDEILDLDSFYREPFMSKNTITIREFDYDLNLAEKTRIGGLNYRYNAGIIHTLGLDTLAFTLEFISIFTEMQSTVVYNSGVLSDSGYLYLLHRDVISKLKPLKNDD
jgi:hypothetical protein